MFSQYGDARALAGYEMSITYVPTVTVLHGLAGGIYRYLSALSRSASARLSLLALSGALCDMKTDARAESRVDDLKGTSPLFARNFDHHRVSAY